MSAILTLESKSNDARVPRQISVPNALPHRLLTILTRIRIPSVPRLPGIPYRYTKRLEKISQRPMVIRARRMCIRVRAARVREGRMGNQSQKRRDETRHDRNEVRC